MGSLCVALLRAVEHWDEGVNTVTFWLANVWGHICMAMAIGNRCCTVVGGGHSGHREWHQCLPRTTARPAELVPRCRLKADAGTQPVLEKKYRPLKSLKKASHALRSARASTVRCIWRDGDLTPMVRSIRRLRKVRPGTTTLVAKFRVPITDWSSRRVTFLLLYMLVIFWIASWTLSGGRDREPSTVSTCIPCSSVHVVGATVFSSLMGMPRSLASIMNFARLFEVTLELAGPKNIKSSNMCDKWGTLNWDFKIHCNAELNFSKVLHDVDAPKGKHLS